jgi:hypothetical protein
VPPAPLDCSSTGLLKLAPAASTVTAAVPPAQPIWIWVNPPASAPRVPEDNTSVPTAPPTPTVVPTVAGRTRIVLAPWMLPAPPLKLTPLAVIEIAPRGFTTPTVPPKLTAPVPTAIVSCRPPASPSTVEPKLTALLVVFSVTSPISSTVPL